jgi:hypothetical protein
METESQPKFETSIDLDKKLSRIANSTTSNFNTNHINASSSLAQNQTIKTVRSGGESGGSSQKFR